MLEHKQQVNLLLDYYGGLLTEKQHEIMMYYFEDDLSLAEIAENLNITRSAVHDIIKRSEAILRHYEEVLKLVVLARKEEDILQRFQKSDNEEILQLIQQLRDIE